MKERCGRRIVNESESLLSVHTHVSLMNPQFAPVVADMEMGNGQGVTL